MSKKWKKVLLVALLGALVATYIVGCGSGVEFGASKFTLTGAGS